MDVLKLRFISLISFIENNLYDEHVLDDIPVYDHVRFTVLSLHLMLETLQGTYEMYQREIFGMLERMDDLKMGYIGKKMTKTSFKEDDLRKLNEWLIKCCKKANGMIMSLRMEEKFA